MINNKRIIIGVATMNSREKALGFMLNSIRKQTVLPDEVIIYNNDKNKFNATDNGKFKYFNDPQEEAVYFFSMDDDIIYPPTYIEDTIKKIEKYKCIVTYHGRVLKGKGLNYYKGHHYLSCLTKVPFDQIVDVPGTGVTAFSTDYFQPNIFHCEDKRMSDLIFAKQAMEQDKNIMILAHSETHFKSIPTNISDSCYVREKGNPRQGQIADEILNMRMNSLMVYIMHYEREEFLRHQIEACERHKLNYTIIDDNSSFIDSYIEQDYPVIKFNGGGKATFYKKWQFIYDHFNESGKKNILIIPEDFYNMDYPRVIKELNRNSDFEIKKTMRDNREACWGGKYPERYNDKYKRDFFIDCTFFTTLRTFNYIGRIPDLINTRVLSSGVGKWYSNQIREKDIRVLVPFDSFAYHGDHLSVMHPTERKCNPLISLYENKAYGETMMKGFENIVLNSNSNNKQQ